MSLLDAEKTAKFFDKTQDLFLYQHVSDFTRVREGQEPSILDYIFTGEESVVEKIECTAPLGKSDHVSIEFNYLTEADVKPTCERIRNYWKPDYSAIKATYANSTVREH